MYQKMKLELKHKNVDILIGSESCGTREIKFEVYTNN